MNSESAHCHKCNTILDIPKGPVARDEECPKCREDVRVCLNCERYDPASYNECSEPMAERVVDKDRRNFCDYFSLKSGAGESKADKEKADALKKLNDLFK